MISDFLKLSHMATATAAQIKLWKQQFGKVFQFQVKVSKEETATGYFKAPDLDTILAMAEFLESDKKKSLMILYNNTKVHVDDIVDTNDQVRFAMIQQIKNLWKNYAVSVKEI